MVFQNLSHKLFDAIAGLGLSCTIADFDANSCLPWGIIELLAFLVFVAGLSQSAVPKESCWRFLRASGAMACMLFNWRLCILNASS